MFFGFTMTAVCHVRLCKNEGGTTRRERENNPCIISPPVTSFQAESPLESGKVWRERTRERGEGRERRNNHERKRRRDTPLVCECVRESESN